LEIRTEMITKISKLSNTRFSNIEGMMEATKKSILEENATLVRLRNEVMGEYKVMALIINEIHAAVYHMQEVEALFYAISQLTRGKLSHQLVGVGAMRAKLRSVSTVLKAESPPGTEYQLLHKDVSYYYHQAIVKGAIVCNHTCTNYTCYFTALTYSVEVKTLSFKITS